MNSVDILHKTVAAQRELFTLFTRAANGFSTDDAIGAAVNIVINALRQSCTTRQEAEIAFDELFGKSKSTLMNHYDSLGRKRGVFPYNQTIEVAHFDARVTKKK